MNTRFPRPGRARQLAAHVWHWLRRQRPGRRFAAALPWVGIAAFAGVAVLAVIVLPPFFTPDLDDPQAQFEVRDRARLTVAAIFGGLVLLAGAYINWRRVSAMDRQVTTMEQQVTTLRRGQITERFTRAIDQLGAVRPDGKPAPEIRAGGVRSLERIAQESGEDYWPVLDILTAYLRSEVRVPDPEGLWVQLPDPEHWVALAERFLGTRNRMDVSFAVDAIGRLWPGAGQPVPEPLNLALTFVPQLSLPEKNLAGADLRHADIRGANLRGADLRRARIEGANLDGANLGQADLDDALLGAANLRSAVLNDGRLQGADLQGVSLWGAHLQGARLQGAALWSADLTGADLTGADLRSARLQGANLRRAKLEGASHNRDTQWPTGFTPPDSEA